MNILAISDIHGEENTKLFEYLKNNDIDLVLISGDITDFGPLEFVDTFINKIFDLDCDVIAVPGNCDPSGICNAIKDTEAICLHNNIIYYGDVVIFGYGGSNPTPFNTPGEIDDDKIYASIYELFAEYEFMANEDAKKIKILLTHAPPYNTSADLTSSGDHVGSQGVKKTIHEFQPDISICGHIHEAKSKDKVGITEIFNPGMLKNNGAVLIEINDDDLTYNADIISLE
ncbi:metallophosphoesterase [Methanobrevibacter sp. OttesenSCG-928-K11]|nr:metallophosphoesterase [Methanobrevibacter sp. OttesenSCG-928-K11]MDL2271205.1 metallophosphoesterase [Methanobrevibacter sp. OttesenSCG-928-I08]